MKERGKSVIQRGPGLPCHSNCKEQKPLENQTAANYNKQKLKVFFCSSESKKTQTTKATSLNKRLPPASRPNVRAAATKDTTLKRCRPQTRQNIVACETGIVLKERFEFSFTRKREHRSSQKT